MPRPRLPLLSIAAGMLLSWATAAAQTTSLYDRLGGLTAITAVTDTFIQKAAADDRIKAKFAKSDVPRLRLHLIEQLCAVTGGPCVYTGRDMKTAHRGMKVTEGEFIALVEDLVAALDQLKVAQTEQTDLLNLLAPLKTAIVEVKSAETGTALPTTFKAAPKLSQAQIKAGPKMKAKAKTMTDEKKPETMKKP